MTYECSCDYGDVSQEWYVETKPTARKQHKCDECGGAIIPGEKYQRVHASWDRSPTTVKTCERCYDIAMWVRNSVPCLCWMHGNLMEECELAIEDAQYRAPQEAAGLKFGYLRRKVLRDRLNQERRKAAVA